MLVKFQVTLAVGEEAQASAAILEDVGYDTLHQHFAAEPLALIGGADGQRAEVPGGTAQQGVAIMARFFVHHQPFLDDVLFGQAQHLAPSMEQIKQVGGFLPIRREEVGNGSRDPFVAGHEEMCATSGGAVFAPNHGAHERQPFMHIGEEVGEIFVIGESLNGQFGTFVDIVAPHRGYVQMVGFHFRNSGGRFYLMLFTQKSIIYFTGVRKQNDRDQI